jgi:hypothetical protein
MSTISVSLKKPGYDPFLGFVPIQGIGLSPRKLFNRCCARPRRAWTSPTTIKCIQDNLHEWVRCKVFRCGERHIFLGPINSLTGSKALPIEIESQLDADLLRSALGFYRKQRISILASLGMLLYLLRLKRMQSNRHLLSVLPRFPWKSIISTLHKTFMFQWRCSIQIVQKLLQDMQWTPVKVLIQDDEPGTCSNDEKEQHPTTHAQLLFTGAPQGQCFVVWVPRSFAIAVASAYRIPIYVSRLLVERNSVYPRVDCRGKWYIANQPAICNLPHLSRNAPIWKYRISELERMDTQQLYDTMIRSGISCSRANTHQELINRLIPFMDRLQRRSVSIWKELWKRKMYYKSSVKRKIA